MSKPSSDSPFLPAFISYAQNGEDIMLRRALLEIEKGFYVDVGANDPVIDSVTKAFYDRGWRGINIEPVEQFHARLIKDRPDDINIKAAISDQPGEIEFFEIADNGLSTQNSAYALRHEEDGHRVRRTSVSTQRLSDILDIHAPRDIHFLKVDVEGAELSVLSSIDFTRHRPWILVVEANKPNSRELDHDAWDALLTSNQYRFVYYDGLNRFYVANEKAELAAAFEAPPNVFDNVTTYREHTHMQQYRQLKESWLVLFGTPANRQGLRLIRKRLHRALRRLSRHH